MPSASFFCRWPRRAECSKCRVDCDPNRPKYYCPFYRDVSKWHQKGLFTSRNRQLCHPANCHRPRKYAHKAGRDANKDRNCGNKDSNRLKINTIEQIRLSSLLHTSNLTLFRHHTKDKIPACIIRGKTATIVPERTRGGYESVIGVIKAPSHRNCRIFNRLQACDWVIGEKVKIWVEMSRL